MRAALEDERQQTNEMLEEMCKLLKENNTILKNIDEKLRKLVVNTN